MSRRQAKILWLKDTLDQLQKSQQELEWTDDPNTIQLVTETMIRDLESCQRICEEIRRRTPARQTA